MPLMSSARAEHAIADRRCTTGRSVGVRALSRFWHLPLHRWKVAASYAIDGNFKLKLKNRGLKDIALSLDLGYFVLEALHASHCARYANEAEVSLSFIGAKTV